MAQGVRGSQDIPVIKIPHFAGLTRIVVLLLTFHTTKELELYNGRCFAYSNVSLGLGGVQWPLLTRVTATNGM